MPMENRIMLGVRAGRNAFSGGSRWTLLLAPVLSVLATPSFGAASDSSTTSPSAPINPDRLAEPSAGVLLSVRSGAVAVFGSDKDYGMIGPGVSVAATGGYFLIP